MYNKMEFFSQLTEESMIFHIFIKKILIYSHFLIIALHTKYFIHFSLFLATQSEESYFPDQGLNPGPQK